MFFFILQNKDKWFSKFIWLRQSLNETSFFSFSLRFSLYIFYINVLRYDSEIAYKKDPRLVFLQPGPSLSNHSGMWPPLRLLLCVRTQRKMDGLALVHHPWLTEWWDRFGCMSYLSLHCFPIWVYVMATNYSHKPWKHCLGRWSWKVTVIIACVPSKKKKPLQYLLVALKRKRTKNATAGKTKSGFDNRVRGMLAHTSLKQNVSSFCVLTRARSRRPESVSISVRCLAYSCYENGPRRAGGNLVLDANLLKHYDSEETKERDMRGPLISHPAAAFKDLFISKVS